MATLTTNQGQLPNADNHTYKLFESMKEDLEINLKKMADMQDHDMVSFNYDKLIWYRVRLHLMS